MMVLQVLPKHKMNIKYESDSYIITITDSIELTIDSDYEISSSGCSTVSLVDKDIALEYGEERLQLLEGSSYNYELTDSCTLQEIPRIVKQNRRSKNRGRITPGIYVGRLPLKIIDSNGNEIDFALEVCSVKTEYRSEYRKMLEDITDQCTDLLMIHSSPVTQRYNVDYSEDTRSLYQKFSFVKSAIDSDHFRNAIQRIISMPVTAWTNHSEEHDIRRSCKIGASQLRQIASRHNRITLPSSHALYSKIKTIPTSISSTVKIDTVDTPENRFIKHVLTEFQRFCGYICQQIIKESKVKKKPHIYHEALSLEEKFRSYLHNAIFSDISEPTSLPLNSPILQRKEGYRDVLRVWLMFDLAAKLTWEVLDDSYSAGKRDIATLYEYWLFFKLLRLLEDIFKIDSKETEKLIQETKDGLGLQLKAGRHTAIEGTYSCNGRDLSIKFNYNRTFKKTAYPNEGSWTQQMRPDYTLSLWPSVFSEKEAESQELIIHIHFDAKYKIEGLKYLSPNEDQDDLDIEDQKTEEKEGTYKRADLLKMHAYKDAIRRTVGAYVLYPGTEKLDPYKGFHEIVPGLGAFPISPSNETIGLENLRKFILEVVDNFTNRASQREKLSYHQYNIFKSNIQKELYEKVPEKNTDTTRIEPPGESTVLIGYYNQDQYQWIEEKCLYNIRVDPKDGLINYGKDIIGAKYLLLHGKDEQTTSKIWSIIGNGPRLISKQDICDKEGYTRTPNSENYFIYDLKALDNTIFDGISWDIEKLSKYSKENIHRPFAVTLLELFNSQ